MIVIDDILISDEIIQQYFVCDLSACKGACCIEGESGAPLEYNELAELERNFKEVKEYITSEGKETIEQNGLFTKDKKGNYKTPLMQDGACAYIRYEHGVAKCGIQKAHDEGKIDFPKPISCHLYPIRITRNRMHKENVNYEEWEICSPACEIGRSLQVPLYKFVKGALIRKYGKTFYQALEKAADLQAG